MTLSVQRLIRVGQAKIKEQHSWSEGISLEKSAGQALSTLRKQVSQARFQLAKEMLQYARSAYKSSQDRLVISRAYYSMYHAMRAAAYIHYGGDDHQQHSDLPAKIPQDFPEYATWGNELKSAREYRNQADYDPYPRSKIYWQKIREPVFSDSVILLPIVKIYLQEKGCRL